jgi:rhodanese-related sulfurtransferase
VRRSASNALPTRSEAEFVDQIMTGLGPFPAYYARMGPLNRRGSPPVALGLPVEVTGGTVLDRLAAGEWVVDLRSRTAFAAAHAAGSLGFELGQSFATYLGWLYRHGSPLTLLGDSRERVAQARRELTRIGVDDLAGMAVGDVRGLVGDRVRSYPVGDFGGLAGVLGAADITVLDVRQADERADGSLPGSIHVALHDLPDLIGKLPPGTLWVHCASGYRASIAASLLDRAGRDVVLVDDDWSRAVELGLAR